MHTAELDVGAVVADRYRLIRPLGAGGMGAVYLARDEALGRDVAIKIFPAAVSDDSDAMRRRDEVTLLAGLSHPGLVVLFDAALDARPPYLTMEHVEGQTLAARLGRGPLPPDEAEALVLAVADALAFVHARGIVHRDIKPANILLPERPNSTGSPAKLADFGIARLVDSAGITATGTVMGTAAYISPEQATGAQVGPAGDIYALGIVLIECLTGRHPYPGTALESAAARLSRQPDLSDPALKAHRALLLRMTARNPGERPSAAAVVADLSGQASTRLMTPLDSTTAPLVPDAETSAAVPALVPAAVPFTDDPAEKAAVAPAAARAAASWRARSRRWRLAVTAAVALLAIAIVSLVAIGIAAGADASPDYPSVDGSLGIHLGQLQDAVAGTALEDPVLSLTNAAAKGRYADANGLLDATAAMLADRSEAGLIPAEQAGIIGAAIVAVRADLAALLSASEPSADPAATAQPAQSGTSTKPDKPAKPPKHDKQDKKH